MENKISYLFEPDVLAAHSMRNDPPLEPEKRLMLAVLADAVECFQKYIFFQDGKEEDLFREAAEWILIENSNWYYSFENICDSLELNPEYIRKGLWLWRERARENFSVIPGSRKERARMKLAS